MRVLVTAGPTREYIDPVRFITNASSGRMGYAVAAAAARAGHEVTLLSGPVALAPPEGCQVVPFVTVAELKQALAERFAECDVLIMAAAVGDFRAETKHPGKLRRSSGPLALRLVATDDVVAELAARKRDDQVVVIFAVEDGAAEQVEAKARAKMIAKKADYAVANTPAAMGAEASEACVLSRDGVVLPWASRSKELLAEEIVKLIGRRR